MSYFYSLNSQYGLSAGVGGTSPSVMGHSPHVNLEEVESLKTSIGTVWIHFHNSKSTFLVLQTTLSPIATTAVTLLRNSALTRMGHLRRHQACEMLDCSEASFPLRDLFPRPLHTGPRLIIQSPPHSAFRGCLYPLGSWACQSNLFSFAHHGKSVGS